MIRVVTALTVLGYVGWRVIETTVQGLDMLGAALGVVSGVAILVGLFTSASAAVLTATIAWVLLIHGDGTSLAAVPTALTFTNALGLLLVGPGAFSIDARLVGRREIIIPRKPSGANAPGGPSQ